MTHVVRKSTMTVSVLFYNQKNTKMKHSLIQYQQNFINTINCLFNQDIFNTDITSLLYPEQSHCVHGLLLLFLVSNKCIIKYKY